MNSIIIGAGKYGEVYLSYLREAGVNVIGFLDDDETIQSSYVHGLRVLGKTCCLPELRDRYGVDAIYCPLGNNRVRVKFLKEARDLGYITPNFIHPSVKISPNVNLADTGVYILGNSFIMPYTTISNDVMISVGTNIVHHTVLKEGVFVSNGVNLGASIVAKEYAYIGMGSTVMTGTSFLGKDCLIGAVAVVIKDVPDGAVMAGVPARIIKYKNGYGGCR